MEKGLEYSVFKQVLDREQNDKSTQVFMRKGDSPDPVTNEDVDLFLNSCATHKTFDEYVEHMFDLYIIRFEGDAQNWKKATCTCPEFSKSFMCKHIICIAYQLELLERPVQRREQFLEANSKRGRPPKARKGGLNRQ